MDERDASTTHFPAARATAILLGLAAVSAALHAFLVVRLPGPFVFMDELGYERMAQSFAHTGHFSLFGKAGLAYSPLYPIVLSPVYALTSSLGAAYEWAKVENAVLISLAVFPVYGIARSVLPRGRSIGVAALSLLAPLMLYSGFEMSESLSYPLCLLAIWTMLRAVRRPSIANDGLMLAAILVAAGARLQLVALLPAALTAFLLVGLARRAIRRTLSEHWALFGVVGVALVAGLVRTIMNNGNLPLAGRYANVGTARANAWRVVELFFQHLAELDFAVGVIPFAAALVAGYALVRSGFPRRALIFASVAVASAFWFLLEVALDAAAFDATSAQLRHPSSFIDVPRIHERYLIYLVPFFLVALFAVLARHHPHRAGRPLAAAAVVSALLPALIPFATVINGTIGIDSIALPLFATMRDGRPIPVTHATAGIVALSGLLAVVFVLAVTRLLPALTAVVITGVAFLGISGLEIRNQLRGPTELVLPAHTDWVDRVAGSGGKVSLIGGPGTNTGSLRETAFWNASIARVYYTCNAAFGPDFGEHQLAAGDGITTRYAVVPASSTVAGRVLARDRVGKLKLIAPTGSTLRIPSELRCRG